MSTVNNPFPYFPDAGTNGYIYIGSANQDAQTNPIVAYRDAELTAPWSQPIRTVNGYAAYQGAKAGIFLGVSEFSITVKDSNGVIVLNDNAAQRFLNYDDLTSATSIIVTARDEAEAAAAAAAAAEVAAEAALAEAESARDAANSAAVAAQEYFPGARSHVPQGAVMGAATISAAGTGGTNGTFDLAWTGGNFAVNPTGTFTVAGGVVTAITITGAGLYIGASISKPTMSFAASSGLSGAAGTYNTAYLKTAGQYWLTDTSPASQYLALFQNQANAAVEIDAQFDPMSAGYAKSQADAAAASAASVANVTYDVDQLTPWTPFDMISDGYSEGVTLLPLDPDAGNLWTDTARTTAVTAVGARVASARMKTQSGFLYAEQATLANRPYLGRYPETGRRNLLANSAATGAVVGSPGTLPTLWGTSPAGLTREIVALGVDPEGIPYIDIRVTGSPGTGGVIQLGGNTDTAVTEGIAHTWSVKTAVIAGSATNITYISLQMNWRNSGGSNISQTTSAVDFKGDATLSARSMTATPPAGAAYMLPQIRLNCSGAVDITLRISGGQVEQGTERTAWQRVTYLGGGFPARLDITEAGSDSVWYLLRSASGVSLPVTLPSYGTSATVMRANDDATSIATAQTVGSGAYEVLGANGSRVIALSILNRGLASAETTLANAWLTSQRLGGGTGGTSSGSTGAVSLSDLGYHPSDGAVGPMLAEAAAQSASNTVILPAGDWTSTGTITVTYNLIFEPGARIMQDHTVAPGIDVTASVRITNPVLSSSVYTETSLTSAANANVSHAENVRGFRISADNVIIENPDMEFMSKGIYTIQGSNYKGLIVTGVRARNIRSTEGWAAVINLKTASGFKVGIDYLENCDRGLEPEDGATDGLFYKDGRGLLKNITAPGHSSPGGAVAAPGYSYVVSAHSHTGYNACRNIHYRDLILEDCETGVWFENAGAGNAQLPVECSAKNITIRGNWTSSTTGTVMCEIGGYNCDVDVTFEAGAAQDTRLRAFVRMGDGNTINVNPRSSTARPFVDVFSSARWTNVSCDSPGDAQTASGNPMVRIRGPYSRVTRVDAADVAYLTPVEVQSTATDSTVSGVIAKVPSSNAPSRAIYLNGAVDCIVSGCVVDDPSGVTLAVEATGTASGNLITGNRFTRPSGNVVTLGASTSGNAVVGNKMAGTVSNSGSGNTVTPNY